MEWLVDLVLFPISLFSGKALAVSIALLVLGSALALWLLISFVYERSFLGVYSELTKAIAAARKQSVSQEVIITEVRDVFSKSRLDEGWEQYSASLDFSDGKVFNYTDPAPFFDSDRLEGHNYPKWSATLGGVFLTIGLFFTFVGLSAALLQVAGDGHGGALGPDKLRGAVENILGISSVKFITSHGRNPSLYRLESCRTFSGGRTGPGRRTPRRGNTAAVYLRCAGDSPPPATEDSAGPAPTVPELWHRLGCRDRPTD